jgi:UDP-2,4-diacetamido-2,4,6-trideoxy-beta-L-gulopyranose hydrolase
VLNSESLRIILVVDHDKKFVGTITDGDIRRALINKSDMETQLHKIMCTNALTASINDSHYGISRLIKEKDLTAIPILDDDGRVVSLHTMNTPQEYIQFENTVFLLAGGFGKRLGSLTAKTPKPLLNVGDKPIIETIIQQLIKFNFKNIIISSHYKSNLLIDYFGNGDSLGVNIQHIYEEKPLGTAGSLGLIDKLPNDKPIIVMNADLLTAVNFTSLLRFHEKSKVQATICAQEYVYQIPFGKLIVKDYRLQSIEEKPKEKSFINAGIYVLEPTVLKRVPKNKYLDMPDLLSSIVSDNEEIAVFPIHEYWLDIGQIEDYKKGQKDYFGEFKN